MAKEVRFMSVINNYRNWPDDVNLEGIDENTIKLKDVINKMFFEEYPEHPQIFVKIFSSQELIDVLINSMVNLGITNLNRIWFRECSEKEKRILIEKGILPIACIFPGIGSMAIARNEQDCFVNVIL